MSNFSKLAKARPIKRVAFLLSTTKLNVLLTLHFIMYFQASYLGGQFVHRGDIKGVCHAEFCMIIEGVKLGKAIERSHFLGHCLSQEEKHMIYNTH